MEENYVTLTFGDGVRTITLNRPERNNAMGVTVYQTITRVLTEDATDDRIVVTIITGSGSYFSSGNDLKEALNDDMSSEDKLNAVKMMIQSFINYPKLLIAVVNGPAIGIGATMAVLCDIVYATDQAIFHTPFVNLGLCAEAASSFTFPNILGRSKASEMLLLSHKLKAREAYEFGLVSKVIPHAARDEFINDLRKYGKLSLQSVLINKRLVMANLKSILNECNNREIQQVRECMESEEFSSALLKFMSKKNKL